MYTTHISEIEIPSENLGNFSFLLSFVLWQVVGWPDLQFTLLTATGHTSSCLFAPPKTTPVSAAVIINVHDHGLYPRSLRAEHCFQDYETDSYCHLPMEIAEKRWKRNLAKYYFELQNDVVNIQEIQYRNCSLPLLWQWQLYLFLFKGQRPSKPQEESLLGWKIRNDLIRTYKCS